jgi:hypothetical protein
VLSRRHNARTVTDEKACESCERFGIWEPAEPGRRWCRWCRRNRRAGDLPPETLVRLHADLRFTGKRIREREQPVVEHVHGFPAEFLGACSYSAELYERGNPHGRAWNPREEPKPSWLRWHRIPDELLGDLFDDVRGPVWFARGGKRQNWWGLLKKWATIGLLNPREYETRALLFGYAAHGLWLASPWGPYPAHRYNPTLRSPEAVHYTVWIRRTIENERRIVRGRPGSDLYETLELTDTVDMRSKVDDDPNEGRPLAQRNDPARRKRWMQPSPIGIHATSPTKYPADGSPPARARRGVGKGTYPSIPVPASSPLFKTTITTTPYVLVGYQFRGRKLIGDCFPFDYKGQPRDEKELCDHGLPSRARNGFSSTCAWCCGHTPERLWESDYGKRNGKLPDFMLEPNRDRNWWYAQFDRLLAGEMADDEYDFGPLGES